MENTDERLTRPPPVMLSSFKTERPVAQPHFLARAALIALTSAGAFAAFPAAAAPPTSDAPPFSDSPPVTDNPSTSTTGSSSDRSDRRDSVRTDSGSRGDNADEMRDLMLHSGALGTGVERSGGPGGPGYGGGPGGPGGPGGYPGGPPYGYGGAGSSGSHSLPAYAPRGGGGPAIRAGAGVGEEYAPAGTEYRTPGGAFALDEVVIEVAGDAPRAAIDALERRHQAVEEDAFFCDLTGDSFILLHVAPRASIEAYAQQLAASERMIISAQPNYLYRLSAEARAKSAKSLQYALAAMRLTEAHTLARGDNVLVGVIDSGVDASQPELAGAVANSFDALAARAPVAAGHGTAIAGLIAAHARLTGSAPAARILSARAFAADGPQDRGSTEYILKSLNWVVANGARVVNMSFAGPADPDLHRLLDRAARRGVTLIAAAGNDGPNAPPLYPAADPAVIAVSATDRADGVFAGANRGRYIQLAAPGVDLLVAAPDGAYEVSTGTSLSAAEVSGVAALMLQRKPGLTPEAVRAALLATARPVRGDVRVVDAYRATLAVAPVRTARR